MPFFKKLFKPKLGYEEASRIVQNDLAKKATEEQERKRLSSVRKAQAEKYANTLERMDKLTSNTRERLSKFKWGDPTYTENKEEGFLRELEELVSFYKNIAPQIKKQADAQKSNDDMWKRIEQNNQTRNRLENLQIQQQKLQIQYAHQARFFLQNRYNTISPTTYKNDYARLKFHDDKEAISWANSFVELSEHKNSKYTTAQRQRLLAISKLYEEWKLKNGLFEMTYSGGRIARKRNNKKTRRVRNKSNRRKSNRK